ncbi:MAG: hypothetical protein EP312_09310 [Gammaproteobacteria bacterium]|nr:MAG: hypothetical protein EP312_09310 [Gammaproteobacteria bacterium]
MKHASRQKLFDALQKVETAGLPPDKAIALLPASGSSEQVLTLTALQKLLKQDMTLSEAALKSGLFEPHEVGLIRIGEKRGKLLETYSWLARHYGNLNGRWQELYSALRLPLIVWVVGTAFLKLMVLTKGGIGAGGFIGLLLIPVASLLAARGFYSQYANRALPPWATELLLKIPGLREQLRQYHEAVFCHHLGIALEAGLPLPEAVGIAIHGIGNPRIRESFGTIESAVESGSTLSDAVSFSDAISRPEGTTAIGTGESTGKLPEALSNYARKLANANDSQWDAIASRVAPLAWTIVILVLLLA